MIEVVVAGSLCIIGE